MAGEILVKPSFCYPAIHLLRGAGLKSGEEGDVSTTAEK